MIPEKKFDSVIPLNKEHYLIRLSTQNQLLDVYEFLLKDKLGQGSDGSVYRVKHKRTGIYRAMKVINKQNGDKKSKVYNEVKIMQELDHPHIAKLFDFFEDEDNIYLIMELCSGGDIFDKVLEIGSFPEEQAQYLFVQLLRAINYYNDFYIVHRDLKPENVLFSKKNQISSLYMIDFGIASKCTKNTSQLNDKVGTIYYLAPEVIRGKYGHECDIWSAGIILYVLLCGFPPFCGDTEKDTMKLIIQGNFTFEGEEWLNVSASCKDLLHSMICDAQQRITLPEIFRHVWVQQFLVKERKMIQSIAEKVFQYQKLERWKSYSHLKKQALLFLSTQVNTTDIDDIKQSFLFINENQNGRISLKEIQLFLKNNSMDLKNLFKIADINQDNYIDFFEFTAICMDKSFYTQKPYLQLSFDFLTNGTYQYITPETIYQIINLQSEIDEVMSESLDQNIATMIIAEHSQDLKINYELFQIIMQ